MTHTITHVNKRDGQVLGELNVSYMVTKHCLRQLPCSWVRVRETPLIHFSWSQQMGNIKQKTRNQIRMINQSAYSLKCQTRKQHIFFIVMKWKKHNGKTFLLSPILGAFFFNPSRGRIEGWSKGKQRGGIYMGREASERRSIGNFAGLALR